MCCLAQEDNTMSSTRTRTDGQRMVVFYCFLLFSLCLLSSDLFLLRFVFLGDCMKLFSVADPDLELRGSRFCLTCSACFCSFCDFFFFDPIEIKAPASLLDPPLAYFFLFTSASSSFLLSSVAASTSIAEVIFLGFFLFFFDAFYF